MPHLSPHDPAAQNAMQTAAAAAAFHQPVQIHSFMFPATQPPPKPHFSSFSTRLLLFKAVSHPDWRQDERRVEKRDGGLGVFSDMVESGVEEEFNAVTSPAVRLPAVKVTLPAAMDYTGEHSQAEYDIALEGRSEAETAETNPVELLDPPETRQYDNVAATMG
ncbi:hypothetical protein EYF80_032837 [Liparis tanakae]|uniref:Uncharacterized protein n=1 Tax=Liparis tanakae TaxID=230148 RepID=A0A4Z2GU38_9TELE|nr:hypothetical protein EYF80_032837 [Liparis tanakae]